MLGAHTCSYQLFSSRYRFEHWCASALLCTNCQPLEMLQGCLDDAALLALVDEDWTQLDVSASAVTHDGLLGALRQLPRLRALDVSGCARLYSKTPGLCMKRPAPAVTPARIPRF